MKNKPFSLSLMREATRQIRTLTLIQYVISLLFAVLLPVGYYITYQSSRAIDPSTGEYLKAPPTNLPGFLGFIYLAPLVLIFTIPMAKTLLHFLLAREESDFYHALPHSRTCIYTSFVAAIILIQAIGLIVPYGVSSIFFMIFKKAVIIDLGNAAVFLVNIFVAILLLLAIMFFTHALSGNHMTAILLTLMVLFIPRILILYFSLVPGFFLNYMEVVLPKWLEGDYHIFYLLFTDIKTLHTFGIHIVYTLALALLYFVLGYVAFCKRRSETAENALDRPWMQKLAQLIITALFSLLPVTLITSFIFEGEEEFVATLIFYTIVCYILVALAMFFFEFFTTKKAGPALKSLRLFPVILAIDAVIVLGLNLYISHYENLKIYPEKVTGVTIHSSNMNSVLNRLYTGHTFTSPEVCELFAKAYHECVVHDKRLTDNPEIESDYTIVYDVTFQGVSKNRFHFRVTSETYNKFLDIISKNGDLDQLSLKLPDRPQSIYTQFASLDLSDARALYQSLQEEIEAMPGSDAVAYSQADGIDSLSCETYSLDEGYQTIILPINEMVPKSYALYIKMLANSSYSGDLFFNDFCTAIQQLLDDTPGSYTDYMSYATLDLTCKHYNYTSLYCTFAEEELADAEFQEMLVFLLERALPASELSSSQTYCPINSSLIIYGDEEITYSSDALLFLIAEDFDAFLKLPFVVKWSSENEIYYYKQ